MLMLGVGFFWAFGSLTLANSSLLFTVGAVTEQLAFAPLAHLLLAYPTGVLERSEPHTPGGSSGLRFQALRPFHGLRPDDPGSAPPFPHPKAGLVDDAAGFT